jgi:hypothetical protein
LARFLLVLTQSRISVNSGTPDANDFYNFNLQEITAGGWSAPDLVDSGRILVGAAGAAPFQNNWVNFDASGATWERASYQKVGRMVSIGGLIYNTTTAVPIGGNGSVIFTLPAGFRPPEDLHIGVQNGANAVCRINIMRNGDVKINYTSIATAAGSSGWWTIGGINFPV